MESHYQAKLATIFSPFLEKIAFTDSSKKQSIAALRSTERCQSATEPERKLDRNFEKVQLKNAFRAKNQPKRKTHTLLKPPKLCYF